MSEKSMAYLEKKLVNETEVNADTVYKEIIKAPWFNGIMKKYPDYNDPKSQDHGNAVTEILDQVEGNYKLSSDDKDKLRDKISAGIS
jgi:hypothetical protein